MRIETHLAYHGAWLGAPMTRTLPRRIEPGGKPPSGDDSMKVAVIGLGYVGTVTAACLAANGHDVWGVDVDAAKVDEICGGRSPVAEAEISLVCVGTPSTARGAADLSYIRRAVADIATALADGGPAGPHSVII